MLSPRGVFVVIVAVSAALVSGCGSGGGGGHTNVAASAPATVPSTPAGSAATSSEPSVTPSTASSAPAQGGECPRDQIPLPDNATIKSETHSGVAGVPCLQYSITMRIGDARAAWENTQTKAKAAGYEVEADKEPVAYVLEAKDNESSPWSTITYTFGEGEVQILAEQRHS
ncbi:hypothetical protein F8568_037010 [Actinomadura sp. LD22]|uniref:Uncharacterized protein n=1 Tax=Actinomadura physcomitrii TaxID=2650748 RepID=A0A6I4MJ67_9ACTN|nr:hypothetical protein [Actinomadura physcomitrii]MWA05862.1 hypothetical protein [Actinomadura physcomitrii]